MTDLDLDSKSDLITSLRVTLPPSMLGKLLIAFRPHDACSSDVLC